MGARNKTMWRSLSFPYISRLHLSCEDFVRFSDGSWNDAGGSGTGCTFAYPHRPCTRGKLRGIGGLNVLKRTFYVSSSIGNDGRTSAQAQSPKTPWKSLSKVNAAMASFQAGDNILFFAGDVFGGQVEYGF